MAVFPPSVFLPVVMGILKETPSVKVGVQDVHYEGKGAFTGALTASMVSSLGVDYVLVGHSERRALFGDDDYVINKKVTLYKLLMSLLSEFSNNLDITENIPW